VAPSRLVWAERVPKRAHLARHQHAGLFLDSFVYNAHSTATDALRAGLPVLTVARETFASRVAASLLRATGLEELREWGLKGFEDLAVELASQRPHALQALRTRQLEALRAMHGGAARARPPALFDIERYTTEFERGGKLMWEVRAANRAPMHIVAAPRAAAHRRTEAERVGNDRARWKRPR
jgi:predicted O-linked N-acetylglucosamine transferase (SPINDLY family)